MGPDERAGGKPGSLTHPKAAIDLSGVTGGRWDRTRKERGPPTLGSDSMGRM